MSRKPLSTKTMLSLTILGLVLPIAIVLILAVAALLAAMSDVAGAVVLRYVALAGGIGWAVVLICLLLAQGLNSLGDNDPSEK